MRHTKILYLLIIYNDLCDLDFEKYSGLILYNSLEFHKYGLFAIGQKSGFTFYTSFKKTGLTPCQLKSKNKKVSNS